MSAGTVFAGVIATILGLVGILQLYGYSVLPFNLAIVSVYLTTLGALIIFGAITAVGLGLIAGGLVTLGEREVVAVTEPTVIRQVVVNQPIRAAVIYPALSELELSVLRLLSQGKNEGEIANATGVALPIVSEKVMKLYIEGYTTEKHALTEKGFEAVQHAGALPMYSNPA